MNDEHKMNIEVIELNWVEIEAEREGMIGSYFGMATSYQDIDWDWFGFDLDKCFSDAIDVFIFRFISHPPY